MRFPRQAKIFRGQLDAAPVAAVSFLLILMLLLAYAHTFIPGVKVQLSDPREVAVASERTMTVLRSGLINFREKEYDIADLEKFIRTDAQTGKLPSTFFFDVEPGADNSIVERIKRVALEVGARLKSPGTRLDLPESAGFAGATQPIVVVAVNLNGQIFLDHQIIREEALQQRLTILSERTERPLTMVLQADKDVRHGKMMQLIAIARKAGVAEVSLATKPPIQPE